MTPSLLKEYNGLYPNHSQPLANSKTMNFFRNNKSKSKSEKSDTRDDSGKSSSKKGKKDREYYKQELKREKEGKRKIFHIMTKLAMELKAYKEEAQIQEGNELFANQTWYEGGLWRAPRVLPNIQTQQADDYQKRTRTQPSVSLSDLFFNLVIVTAFTRVGVAVTNSDQVTKDALLYFAVFWTIWSKEADYSTRFDTSDLSAKAEILMTCFAVLLASLSVTFPIDSEGGARIMIAAAFCSLLHCGLMLRVFFWHRVVTDDNPVVTNVTKYALFGAIMNFLEAGTWMFGVFLCPLEYRWIVFTAGVVLALRIPRAFMANDFHAACTKRGVLFILLLGFTLQSVLIAATDFFDGVTPEWEQYSFIGSACLLLFCIKLLYVDDAATFAADHALLVNGMTAFFFSVGQFTLLFSTTIMGSGFDLLTRSYLADGGELPANSKALVYGGFSAVLISTMFIKSMHLKRIPIAAQQKCMFIGAYAVQMIATIAIATIALFMALGLGGGYLEDLVLNDLQLMWALTGSVLFLVVLSWLDESLELALHGDETESAYMLHPYGFWCCLNPEADIEDARLSELSPLLGESISNLQPSAYDSTTNEEA